MSKKETAKDKKVKDLISDLESKDSATQLKAVKALKIHGNDDAVEPLLLLLSRSAEGNVRSEIIDLINTTKSSTVPAVIANALIDKRFASIRHDLLISVWSSGLDYRPYLKEIIIAGTEGEMMDALECITIVENLDGGFSEDQLFDPIIVLKEYIVAHKDEDSPKMNMLKEVLVSLQQFNNQL